jgi:hypothetical protein
MLALGKDIINSLTSVENNFVEIVLNFYYTVLKTLSKNSVLVQNTSYLIEKITKLFLNLVKFENDNYYKNRCLLTLVENNRNLFSFYFEGFQH